MSVAFARRASLRRVKFLRRAIVLFLYLRLVCLPAAHVLLGAFLREPAALHHAHTLRTRPPHDSAAVQAHAGRAAEAGDAVGGHRIHSKPVAATRNRDEPTWI